MVDITKNFVTECLLTVQTFLNQYSEKCSAGKWYMDGWIKLQKREKKLFTYEVQCISTKTNLCGRFACCRCSLPS